MADINGDGKPDLALAHYGRSGVIWIDFAGPEPKVHSRADTTRTATASAWPTSTAMGKSTF